MTAGKDGSVVELGVGVKIKEGDGVGDIGDEGENCGVGENVGVKTGDEEGLIVWIGITIDIGDNIGDNDGDTNLRGVGDGVFIGDILVTRGIGIGVTNIVTNGDSFIDVSAMLLLWNLTMPIPIILNTLDTICPWNAFTNGKSKNMPHKIEQKIKSKTINRYGFLIKFLRKFIIANKLF